MKLSCGVDSNRSIIAKGIAAWVLASFSQYRRCPGRTELPLLMLEERAHRFPPNQQGSPASVAPATTSITLKGGQEILERDWYG